MAGKEIKEEAKVVKDCEELLEALSRGKHPAVIDALRALNKNAAQELLIAEELTHIIGRLENKVKDIKDQHFAFTQRENELKEQSRKLIIHINEIDKKGLSAPQVDDIRSLAGKIKSVVLERERAVTEIRKHLKSLRGTIFELKRGA